MKRGDLISLKPEYQNTKFTPAVYMIVDQDRTAPQQCYVLLELGGEGYMIKLPLSSIYAYEVISEAG